MKQAEWNGISWGSLNRQLAYLKSLNLSQKIKTEEKQNEQGGNKTVVLGLDSENLTISYSASFAVGLDPRGEFEMLKKTAGMQDTFILGGQKLSKNNFSLNEIELSNTTLSNNGVILSGELKLNFTTESKLSSKGGKAVSVNKVKKEKKSSFTLTAEDYAKAKALVK